MKFKYFSFPKDIYIFILIPFKIIYFRQKINKIGFNTILSGLEGNSFTRLANEKFLSKFNKFYKVSTFFLVRIFKDPNPCMLRSLILYGLCNKYNIKASLITGVSKKEDVLTGHSWLEINGDPINENRTYISNFTIIYKI